MKIISQFHDYYDPVQASGRDGRIVYVRKMNEVEYEDNALFPFPVCRSSVWFIRSSLNVSECIVGFCGKIYPLLKVSQPESDQTRFCYSTADVDDFVEQFYSEQQVTNYHTKNPRKLKGDGRLFRARRFVEQFFAECEQQKNQHADLFAANKTPIFVATFRVKPRKPRTPVEKSSIVFNARLAPYKFIKMFDPFMTYQEIAMYLGGVLAAPEKAIPKIDDRTMRDIKGFDEWSFKKPPRKKR